MGITLIGQTGLNAADLAAEESKAGRENVTIPVPYLAEEIVRRLGQILRRSIATQSLAQSTGTGTRGACGASALSNVDRVRGNACASVITRRPSLEGRVAWALIDKPCLAVCPIALLTVNGESGRLGLNVPQRVVPRNARELASAIILQPRMVGKLAMDLRNRKSTATWSLVW